MKRRTEHHRPKLTLKLQRGNYYTVRADDVIVGFVRGGREDGWTFKPVYTAEIAGLRRAWDTTPRRAAVAAFAQRDNNKEA